MEKILPLTIINDKNLRGVLASSNVLSKKTLEDIVDIIELSRPKIVEETKSRIKGANSKKSWLSLKEVRGLAKKAK